MHWNYRVIKHVDSSSYQYYAIHEVYYDSEDDSKVRQITLKPITIEAETTIDLGWILQEIGKAFEKPILNFEDLIKIKRIEG